MVNTSCLTIVNSHPSQPTAVVAFPIGGDLLVNCLGPILRNNCFGSTSKTIGWAINLTIKGVKVLLNRLVLFPISFVTGLSLLLNVAKKLAPLAQATDECQEAYNQYKVYNEMSSTLSKVSKKVRKDKETSKSVD
jgi:hypothetical protein